MVCEGYDEQRNLNQGVLINPKFAAVCHAFDLGEPIFSACDVAGALVLAVSQSGEGYRLSLIVLVCSDSTRLRRSFRSAEGGG